MTNESLKELCSRDDFKKCFPEENSYLKEYLKTLFFVDPGYSEEKTKFYLIPKYYFQLNDLAIDNTERNVIYVRHSQYLRLNFILMYYFQCIDDAKMHKKAFNQISRKVSKVLPNTTLKNIISKNGDIPSWFYGEYERFQLKNG